jgi:hypothetical protein
MFLARMATLRETGNMSRRNARNPTFMTCLIMPAFPRKLLGLILIIAAVGVASWQALGVSCSSPAAAGAAAPWTFGTPR